MAWVWSWLRRLVTDGRARLVLFTKISLPVSVLTGGWKLVLAVPYESLLLAITGLYAVTCIPMVVGTQSWTKNYTEVAGIAIATITFTEIGLVVNGAIRNRHHLAPMVAALQLSNLAGATGRRNKRDSRREPRPPHQRLRCSRSPARGAR